MDGKSCEQKENRVSRHGKRNVDSNVLDVCRKDIAGRFHFGQGVICFKDGRRIADGRSEVVGDATQKNCYKKYKEPA